MARETAQQTRPDPSCVVPREPLVALVNSPSAGDLIAVETVETASLALYWVGVFNQLVQQQTDFNARHLAEIRDARIEEERLAAIGRGAYEISHMVHATGIASANAEGGWYRRLSEAVETNIADLEKRLRSWRQYTWVGLTVGLLLGTLVLAGWRLLDDTGPATRAVRSDPRGLLTRSLTSLSPLLTGQRIPTTQIG